MRISPLSSDSHFRLLENLLKLKCIRLNYNTADWLSITFTNTLFSIHLRKLSFVVSGRNCKVALVLQLQLSFHNPHPRYYRAHILLSRLRWFASHYMCNSGRRLFGPAHLSTGLCMHHHMVYVYITYRFRISYPYWTNADFELNRSNEMLPDTSVYVQCRQYAIW